jgi:hypothetical protein
MSRVPVVLDDGDNSVSRPPTISAHLGIRKIQEIDPLPDITPAGRTAESAVEKIVDGRSARTTASTR